MFVAVHGYSSCNCHCSISAYYCGDRVFAAPVPASEITISGNAQKELASFCMLVEFRVMIPISAYF